MPCVIQRGGRPRATWLRAGRMEADQAEGYHAAQIETLCRDGR